ncbi:universal stress protein [Desulfohalovibrio reitneri]|uniref:universal stress protein n=1 Tax=Desulfohalovibrio reitneri TaxID=1307759 RepID=UPI0004A6B275|nr:universal stress protein [Desulfohalovibrio reitneri]
MFKDIILAVTPSEICECAVDAALAYARRFDSKLYLTYVTGIERGWGDMEHLEASGECQRLRENIETYYKEKLEGVPNLEILVKAGIPYNEILRLVRQKKADLVVMGPHTKEYTERRSKMWGMAGSTLERVSQRAPCPVMVVTSEVGKPECSFDTILVCTDFSKPAECAVNYGGQMARHYKSRLIILHVQESGAPQEQMDAIIQENRDRMREEFAERLKGIEKVDYECTEGKPSTEILKAARINKAGLVIMAHHSKEVDPEKALLGSTVIQVALNSACPTMSVNKHFDLRCGLMYDQTGAVAETTAQAETQA